MIVASSFQLKEAETGYRHSSDAASRARVREHLNAGLRALPEWPEDLQTSNGTTMQAPPPPMQIAASTGYGGGFGGGGGGFQQPQQQQPQFTGWNGAGGGAGGGMYQPQQPQQQQSYMGMGYGGGRQW